MFYAGCPSAVKDVESTDWAPTVNLGYDTGKPVTEASHKREQRRQSREAQVTCTNIDELPEPECLKGKQF